MSVFKSCTWCHATQPLDDFYRKIGVADGRQSHCKACEKARDRTADKKVYHKKNRPARLAYLAEWRAKNPDKARACGRTYALASKYGITPDDYEAMVKAQDGRCATCRRLPQGHWKRLCVDHCHETLVIRGLLCSACNVALGALEDDTEVLAAAIAYLRKHEKNQERVG